MQHQYIGPLDPTGYAQQQAASGAQQAASANYGFAAAGSAIPPAAPPNGLILDAGAVMARLSNILDRVRMVDDRLNGFRPSAEPKAATDHLGEPDTMRRLIDRAIELVNRIDCELCTIESKL